MHPRESDGVRFFVGVKGGTQRIDCLNRSTIPRYKVVVVVGMFYLVGLIKSIGSIFGSFRPGVCPGVTIHVAGII